MKYTWIFFILLINQNIVSKEYKSLKAFQKETGLSNLLASDWLTSDRRKVTDVWKQANHYNLENLQPQEYVTIAQRRDFYEWFYKSVETKGHEVVWPKMAHYISKKLQLTNVFPFNVFTKSEVKNYAYQGSHHVFTKAFPTLKSLFYSTETMDFDTVLEWDESILYQEQYVWLQELYDEMDSKTLKTIDKMVKGKGFYSLLVPSDIRFSGTISNAEARYQYALNALRPYCKNHYK